MLRLWAEDEKFNAIFHRGQCQVRANIALLELFFSVQSYTIGSGSRWSPQSHRVLVLILALVMCVMLQQPMPMALCRRHLSC
mmetsp:Transcript_4261/g.6527  ORF Transcript_4261/g.6527 Transcript_4261/m.6527 type:complete len:82 (+) Transcript_4261:1335-1580(+)